MSLYIGNLSSHTRRDDLERVFSRFGHCNIRIKDGYGFVVYVFPPDAEKALRALQGRNICGRPLTLTWSNKQPRAFKRFARDDRSYEPLRRRYSTRGGDYVNRNFESDVTRDYKMGTKHPDRDGGRLSSADVLNEERSDNLGQMKDFIGEDNNKENHDKEDLQIEGPGVGEHFLEEGGSVERNLVENGRWGEHVHDLSNGSASENRKDYDQYDAYQGYYKKEEDEGHHKTSSNDSFLQKSYQEKKGRENTGEVTLNHHSGSKFKQTCYSCGELGHKSRSCPFVYTSRRNLAKHDPVFINDNNKDGRGQSERRRIRSITSGKRQTSRDTVRRRDLRDDRKSSGSRKRPKLTRSGSSPMAKDTDKAPIEDYGEKKYGRHSTKNTKRSVSYSPNTASKSQSASLSLRKRRPQSHSRSRSVSSRIQSLTSDSKSSSTSRLSRSKSFNSRRRSSSPTSLSLSASLRQPLPAYPNEGKSNLKDSVDKGATPKSTKEFIEQEQQLVDVSTGLEIAEPENMVVAVSENGVSSCDLGNEIIEDQTLQRDNDDDKIQFKALNERTNPNSTMSDKGTLTATVRSSLGSLKEGKENRVSDLVHTPVEMEKLDFDSSCISQSKCRTSISPEELNMVLNHYGLKGTNESERQLPVEDYYGSSRLWPWEIIYYRRLKKGHITTENYARRIAQNREFGITDKYVRSSSGWYEFGEDNP